MHKAVFGVIGLGVMGKSISLNIAEKDFDLSVYNRVEEGEAGIVKDFLATNDTFKNISGYTDLPAFVKSLERPRKILIMIKAGAAIDSVLGQLQPLLSEGDIIIDGGNSHFSDTKRRVESLKKDQLHFIGCGISGGEEGARKGPSIMPGGDLKSYRAVAPVLEAIAAKDANNDPCCAHIGPDGAGHFIKMIHNGIEYAEMQLLAEAYALLSVSMNNEEIAHIFSQWNASDLSGYLLEITIDILQKKEGDQYLLDIILDKAGSKGTGSWSGKTAFDLGVPATMISSSVFARYLSSLKEKRMALSKTVGKRSKTEIPDIVNLEKAYRFARIINHHQGFQLMKEASAHYDWNLNLSEIARIWTNGCIIRSGFMEASIEMLKKHEDHLAYPELFEQLIDTEAAIRETIRQSLSNRVTVDTFWAAYNYWVSMTTENLPANLIQAQRDYFGAHTYQRKDADPSQFFHTNWLQT